MQSHSDKKKPGYKAITISTIVDIVGMAFSRMAIKP